MAMPAPMVPLPATPTVLIAAMCKPLINRRDAEATEKIESLEHQVPSHGHYDHNDHIKERDSDPPIGLKGRVFGLPNWSFSAVSVSLRFDLLISTQP
jgi:hypothetical protein